MKQNRSNLALGLILLIIGGWLLVTRQVPELQAWMENNFTWPMWVIGAGVLVLLIGLVTGAPDMAVPASIIAGVGGILYYQQVNDNFGSWSYMWTLIPGFVGVGTILTGLLGEHTRRNIGHGLRLIVTSAVLFLVFGTFLGGLDILGEYGLPVILILLGVYVLARGFIKSPKRGPNEA
jgi:hypothetical protein